MSSDGKSLEKLLGQAVKEFGFSRSTSHSDPLCDRVQFLKRKDGRGLIWECKEVRKDSFSLTDMTQNERDTMRDAVKSHVIAIIVFQHWFTKHDWRLWAAFWQHWKAHEDAIGFVEKPTFTAAGFKPRRKPGSASVSMVDPARPGFLVPIPVINKIPELSLMVHGVLPDDAFKF